ncbi:MAG: cytochrome c3 family protein [Ignavibacteriaceae bacterium]|nr:cytochrome c3 family protein [Ignavibacteriaceae bacterium]
MNRNLLLTAIFLLTASGILFSQETNYYLGTGNGSEPQGRSCASCHQSGNIGSPKYDTYKNTLHAVSYDSLKTMLSYDCLSCHTTGWIPGPATYGADEYVLKDSTKTPNYVITNIAAFNRVKNVGCEACHGPLGIKNTNPTNPGDTVILGANHWDFKNINKLNYSAELCGQCHQGVHNPYYDEWQQSVHAHSNISFVVTNKSCVRCHVAQNFILWASNPQGYRDTILATGSDVKPLTCVACHDPHAKNNQHQLRFAITPQSTICDQCHNNADTIIINSTPHQTTSKALTGSPLFGYQYPGETYINSAHTYAATERCVNCHVYASPFNGQTSATGHTFFPRVEACRNCHSDFYTVVDTSNHDKMFDYRGTQTRTDSLINVLQTKINKASHNDSLTTAFMQANYNLLSITGEGSHGIHNTRLVQKLLRDAIARFTPTALLNETGMAPNKYELSQNYPNPFNPSTTIKFSIPESGNVKVVVYDAIGKEVVTLTNNFYQAGKYKIEWNASSYASGIYFYRLVSKDFQMVRKMVLIK